MLDSWPTFIFQEDPKDTSPFMYLAVKDDNIPGKLNLGGANIGEEVQMKDEMLSALKSLCGEAVVVQTDDYDKSFDICFKNVKITTGYAAFSFTKPYFPHGYVLDAILHI